MTFNRKQFFSAYKSKFGKLTIQQTQNLEFFLSKFEEDGWTDFRLIAYVLATVKHETADTFAPIKEYRSRVGSKGRANQDRYWLSGFYGRGYVQLTWKKNYETLGKKLGVDLTANPNLALKPEIAYEILVIGMLQGLFTGQKLSDYINKNKTDYVNARRIVNGTDKADLIAGYAKKLENILDSSSEQTTSAAERVDDRNPPSTDAFSRSDETGNQPPNPTTETEVEVKDGDVKIKTSENKQPEKAVGIEKPERKGFINTIRAEISALVAGNIGVQAVSDYAHQARIFGLSDGFWTTVGVLALVAAVIYLIYRYLDYRADSKRDLALTNKLIEANSTPDNKVYLVDKEHLDYLDAKDFEVIRR